MSTFDQESPINLDESDPQSIRRLMAAIFEQAISEANLLSEWKARLPLVIGAPITDKDYVLAVQFMQTYSDLARFHGCTWGTEFLLWLGIDDDAYWPQLNRKLQQVVGDVPAVRQIIRRWSSNHQ